MARLRGIGTGLLGWRHRPEGSTATLWLTAAWLPLVPLGRYRVRRMLDVEPPPGTPALAAALFGGLSWTEPVELLERGPLVGREVVSTWLRCWLAVPLLGLWPLPVAGVVSRSIETGPVAGDAIVAATLVGLVNVAALGFVALRRRRA